jgi:arsenite methyltransferase
MSPGLDYDEEASRRLEVMYVTADVVAQRRAFIEALGIRPGERVLDVGSGPGFLLAEIAEVVGSSGAICGLDISESMVQMARKRCADLPTVTVEVGDAHNLQFDECDFDVAVSTQVLEYVADPVGVLKQMFRVIRPGGRVGVLATDWASMVWHGTNEKLMERVLSAWSEHCADPHLPRTLGPKLLEAGFEITGRSIIPLYSPETHEGTYSGGLIELIVRFASGRSELTDEELDGWATELRTLGDQKAYFFSLNRYLFVARRPH